MTARNKPMAPKRALFVLEYLKDLNATQAAIRAGYSVRAAAKTGSDLLHFPEVARAIDAAKLARSAATKIDAEWVLRQLQEVYSRVMQEVRPAMDRRGRPIKDEDGAVLYRFDAANANRSLELIGKHISVQSFSERVEVRDTAGMIRALHEGRRRASRIPLAPGETPPSVIDVPDSGVVDALRAGRHRVALSKPTEGNDDVE